MKKNNKNKLFKAGINNIVSIYITIAFISIVTILVMNMNFIYKLMINKLHLSNVSGVNKENIMIDYRTIIYYLQNPFIKDLQLDNFDMSQYGYIHFYEVKRIFVSLIIISFIFIVILLATLIFTYKYKKIDKIDIAKVFNKSFNILITFIITIFIAIKLNFSKAFTIFHKILFRNDYWLLDPNIDPIIKVLPEEVFFTYGVVIISIISIIAITGKIFCRKSLRI